MEALQATAGNRAVSQLVQRFVGPPQVDYSPGSVEGDDAFDYRATHNLYDPGPNVAVLYEGGRRVGRRESAVKHAEELLIGGHITGDNAVPAGGVDLTSYRTRRREKATLYTERVPCRDCTDMMNRALRADDEVKYSVGWGPEVTTTLEALIATAQTYRAGAAEEAAHDG